MLPLSLSLYILAPSSLFLNPNRDFSSEIRLLPWSKFVKDLSQRFTAVPISRRCNEHKTRPCSLVLIRCYRYLPAKSFFVLRSPNTFPPRCSSSVLLCLHQRRHAEVLYFPWAVQDEWNLRPSLTEKAIQHTVIVLRARAQSDGAHAIRVSIDSEFRVSGAPRETINYAIIDPDWIIREI